MMSMYESDEDLIRKAHEEGLLMEYLGDSEETTMDELMQLRTELERDKIISEIGDMDIEDIISALFRLNWSESIVVEMCLREEKSDE